MSQDYLKELISEIIKENLEIPNETLEGEIKSLIKQVVNFCDRMAAPMKMGVTDSKDNTKIKSFAQQAYEINEILTKRNHPFRRDFQANILNGLLALEDKNSFSKTPLFLGKNKHAQEIINNCQTLKSSAMKFAKQMLAIKQRYGV